jgi:MtrB/PioB family decaheme-associated outer membrane protein
MRFKRKTLYIALATACVFPMGAMAFDLDLGDVVERDMERWNELTQVQSWVEFGASYVSDDSFKFGEYTGLGESGVYPALNFDIRKREAYDSESARYWTLRGTDLGLSSRSLSVEQGDQGRYKVWLDYSQLPQLRSDVAQTVFNGAGTTSLTLPATGSLATLDDNLRRVDLEQERRRLGVGGELQLTPRWLARLTFASESKEGTKATGFNNGSSWMTAKSALVPEAVDHVTNKMGAALAYSGDKGQAEFGYHLSLFENQKRSQTWQDPYATDWTAAATQESALSPDNAFHQLRLSGGYNLTPVTRLHADGAIGRMIQDETFINSTAAVSRTKLGGEIDTTVANVGVSSRPSDKLNLSASYRYDDRDNNTPIMVVDGVTNRPYSYTENRTRVAASYRLQPRTTLSLGFDRRDIDRTLVASESSVEDTWEARVRTAFGRSVSGGLVYALSDREGSTYTGSALLPEQLRQSWIADRERDKVGLFASFTPFETVTLGLKSDRVSDTYTASQLGLTDAEAVNYSLDASYTPVAGFSAYAFYSVEQNESRQAGATWRAVHEEDTGSAGVGLRKSLLGGRLDLETDLVYSQSVGSVSVDNSQLPDTSVTLRQLSLGGAYRMSKDLTMRMRYRMEHYDSRDWALDGVAPDAVVGLITMGEESPDYDVHLITVSVAYRF